VVEPSEQVAQEVAPGEAENEPARHSLQGERPEAEEEPAGQKAAG
jgi:hypothetical protein